MDDFAYALTDHSLKRWPSLLPAKTLRRPTSMPLRARFPPAIHALTARSVLALCAPEKLSVVPVSAGYQSVTSVLLFSGTTIQAPESIAKNRHDALALVRWCQRHAPIEASDEWASLAPFSS
ncbi:hypothetical protein GGG16DRAFT_117525 [Schizophyllum commune]